MQGMHVHGMNGRLIVEKKTRGTYIFFPVATMNSSNEGRRIRGSPCRLWHRIRRFRIVSEQVLDGAGHLSQPVGNRIEVHLIIALPNLVRDAAGPRLDLVELVLLFIVPRLADIDLLAHGEATRPSFVEARHEHDEASVQNLIYAMVTVLTRLDNLILEEVFLEAVDGLLGSVIPAGVDPLLPRFVLPSSIYLGDNRFRQVVRVRDVNPIT